MTWRIYRLPGSREIWHVDSGEGTQVFNVRGYAAQVPTSSIDGDASKQPRAWIEARGEFYIIDGIALFDRIRVAEEKRECVAPPA